MGLAIDAKRGAVGVDDDDGIVVFRAVFFVDRYRDNDAQLLCELAQLFNGWVLCPRIGCAEELLVLHLAEIVVAEEFRRQDDLGALAGRLAHQRLHLVDIGLHVLAERSLDRGDLYSSAHVERPPSVSGTCWVMQWKLPPPERIWRDGRAMTSWSGIRA